MLARSFVTLLMLAIFGTMIAIAMTYPPGARFMVLVVGIPAMGLCLLQLAIDFTRGDQPAPSLANELGIPGGEEEELPPAVKIRREIIIWTYFLSFIAIVLFFGFWVAIPILLLTFLWLQAELKFTTAFLTAAIATPVLFVFFEKILETQLHRGFLMPRIWEELERIEALAPLLKLLS